MIACLARLHIHTRPSLNFQTLSQGFQTGQWAQEEPRLTSFLDQAFVDRVQWPVPLCYRSPQGFLPAERAARPFRAGMENLPPPVGAKNFSPLPGEHTMTLLKRSVRVSPTAIRLPLTTPQNFPDRSRSHSSRFPRYPSHRFSDYVEDGARSNRPELGSLRALRPMGFQPIGSRGKPRGLPDLQRGRRLRCPSPF